MRAPRLLRSPAALAAVLVTCIAMGVTATAELIGRTTAAATPPTPGASSRGRAAADGPARLAREAAAGRRVAAAAATARQAALTTTLRGYADNGAQFAVAMMDNMTGTSYTFGTSERFETASIMKVEI